MDFLPGVVSQLSMNKVEAKPKLVTLSSDDHMIFVSETMGLVFFYKLPEFTETRRIFIQNVICEDMKYIEETDGLDDDTIIVENLKERYDASINSQLDVIIRNIYDNSQNGKLDLEQYENEAE